MASQAKVGERIKSFRKQLNMTLAEFAQKSTVEESVIASIEDGEVMPALGILTKLSRALGQRLGTFMDDQFTPDPIITRASDLQKSSGVPTVAGVKGRTYTCHSLALGKPDRHMDPFFIELPAHTNDEVSSHEGEELIICISGEIEIVYGEDLFVLQPGDSAYYNSVVKHLIRAKGDTPATIYGVVFMPA